jgi:hypothetical protein
MEIDPLYVKGEPGNMHGGGCYTAHLTLTTPSESCPTCGLSIYMSHIVSSRVAIDTDKGKDTAFLKTILGLCSQHR